MIKCKACGAANTPDSSVCAECGAKLRVNRKAGPKKKKKRALSDPVKNKVTEDIFSTSNPAEAEKAAEPIRDVFSSEEAYEKAKKGNVLEKIHVLEEEIGDVPELIEELEQRIVPTVINRTTSNDIIRTSEQPRNPKDKKHDIPHRVIRPVKQAEEAAAEPEVIETPVKEETKATESLPREKERTQLPEASKKPAVKKRRKKKETSPEITERKAKPEDKASRESAGKAALEAAGKEAQSAPPAKQTETVAAMSAAPKVSHKSVSIEKTEQPHESAVPEDELAMEIETLAESVPAGAELPSDEPAEAEAEKEAAAREDSETESGETEQPVIKQRVIPSAAEILKKKSEASEPEKEPEKEPEQPAEKPDEAPERKEDEEPASEISSAEEEPEEAPVPSGEEALQPEKAEEPPLKKKNVSEGEELPKKKKKKPAEGEELPKKKKKKPAEGEELPKRKKTKPSEAAAHEDPSEGSAKKKRRFDKEDVEANKYIAALSYLGVLLLIPHFARKDSKFCRAHVRQGVAVLIWSLIVGVVTLGAVLALRALILWLFGLSVIIYDVAALAVTACMLTLIFIPVFEGAVGAFGGMYKQVPFVGKYVKNKK